MKRLVAILFLLPSLAFGTIARVQSKSANTGSAAGSVTLTITLTSPATIGNTLFVIASAGANINGITFGTKQTVVHTSGASSFAFIPVREASSTIVITANSSVRIAAVAAEYSGTLVSFDIPTLAASGSSTSNATGTLQTTTYANELIVAGMAKTGTAYASEQTAWLTSITNSFVSVLQTSSFNNASTDRAVALLERFVTATGTYSTAGTQANTVWGNFIASFVDNPGCAPGATATPTATPSATATATATSTPTVTPTPCASGISRARAENPQ